jgi:hypothetical protein
MKLLITSVLLLMPHLLYAATNCRATEYPDHYLAECLGNEQADSSPASPTSTGRSTTAPPGSATNAGEKSTAQPTVAGSSAETSASVEALYGPRPGRMSKSRVEAAIAARNKLLQGE